MGKTQDYVDYRAAIMARINVAAQLEVSATLAYF